jgi:hypothetical protein
MEDNENVKAQGKRKSKKKEEKKHKRHYGIWNARGALWRRTGCCQPPGLGI